jgi:(E)-4-hydroxy-3-methylbut-2-enyl-diphosphate synthase
MDYNAYRRKTKEIKVGTLSIGGSAKISVQSMTNTPAEDFEKTFIQVKSLVDCGCDIVRISTPTVESCEVFKYIKARGITAPLVADIHFNHEIAIRAVECGADKIRINPGNIGSNDKVKSVVSACLERDIPIRIGVNAGSLEKELLCKYGAPVPEALVESALRHIDILEKENYDKIIVSIKASNVQDMIAANRLLAEKVNYPLHLGVTEAGARERALVKSSIGIGTLLSLGIGDTIRVSLTDAPEREVGYAEHILASLGLFSERMDIISCPTCARTKIDLISIAKEFEERVEKEHLNKKKIKVAIMGCVVNGPGEAREADIGVAGGDGCAVLFRRGELVRKISEDSIVSELISEIKKM